MIHFLMYYRWNIFWAGRWYCRVVRAYANLQAARMNWLLSMCTFYRTDNDMTRAMTRLESQWTGLTNTTFSRLILDNISASCSCQYKTCSYLNQMTEMSMVHFVSQLLRIGSTVLWICELERSEITNSCQWNKQRICSEPWLCYLPVDENINLGFPTDMILLLKLRIRRWAGEIQ